MISTILCSLFDQTEQCVGDTNIVLLCNSDKTQTVGIEGRMEADNVIVDVYCTYLYLKLEESIPILGRYR